MQTQKIIEALGYTPNEAKVYLTALELGECHVSDISAKLRLPRSSVQVIIDKLHKNGLMNFYIKNRYKYWIAEDPGRLLEQLKAREDMVRAAMPRLSRLHRETGKEGKPLVRVFVGRDEIQQIFDDIIETKHHIQGLIPQDAFLRLFEGTSAIEDFLSSRESHFLRLQVLVPDTPAGRALAEHQGKHLREVRFLPSRIGLATASVIYGDKVALLMFNQKQPTAVLIEDAAIRETQAALFEELWSRSGEEGENTFAKQEDLFRLLVDTLPQPLLITNQDVEIEYVNGAWEKQFGYLLEEVKGQNPRLLQSGKTPREVYERMWKTLEAGQSFQSDEIVNKRKNGSFCNLLTTIFSVHTGTKLHYVQILDDITQRKRVAAMRKNFLLAAAEGAPAPLKKVVKKLLDDSSFD